MGFEEEFAVVGMFGNDVEYIFCDFDGKNFGFWGTV